MSFIVKLKNMFWNTVTQRGPLRSLSPHATQIYQWVLEELVALPHVRFVSPQELLQQHPDTALLCLRHDVDNLPERTRLLTDIEYALGLRSVIYVLTQGSYSLQKHAALFQQLREKGFLIGLHTIAPAFDNPLEYFLTERNTFQNILGFTPTCYTLHGLSPSPPHWQKKKNAFNAMMATQGNKLGIAPNTQFMKGISFVEDSAQGGLFGLMHHNFFRLNSIKKGTKIELLTHPEHWVETPVGSSRPDFATSKNWRRNLWGY